ATGEYNVGPTFCSAPSSILEKLQNRRMEVLMWNTVKAVLAAFGGTAALVGACIWLARGFLKQFMNRDLESFKSQLEAAKSHSLETYRQAMMERWEGDKRNSELRDVKRERWLNEKRVLYKTMLRLQAKGRDVAYV